MRCKNLAPDPAGLFKSAGRFFLASRYAVIMALLTALSACGGSNSGSVNIVSPDQISASALSDVAKLGEKIFDDRGLSASGAQACSTCHNPHNAHAPTNDLAVQLGGADLNRVGFRAAPSIRYLHLTPAPTLDANAQVVGGFNLDGRSATLAEQAVIPLLAAAEMANGSKAEVVMRLQKAAYADEFRTVFGASIFDHSELAFERLVFALQRYQLEDTELHSFDSKYDQFLKGKVALTESETRGLAWFNNPAKGNCAICHPSAKAADGGAPLFTTFRFANLGVPRNAAIPANASAGYFDLGACGPNRLDLNLREDLCGSFKIPSLRNVATRKVFFHNGSFKNLTDVVSFLVQRDTQPEKWYPQDELGMPIKFNDLPKNLRINVDMSHVPFNRTAGALPALSNSEIADVVEFLGTLTDGYKAH